MNLSPGDTLALEGSLLQTDGMPLNNSFELLITHQFDAYNTIPLTSMFVSVPQHEFPMPAGLAEPGAKYWRSVELSLHMPWFLVTIESPDGGGSCYRTICVSWDTDLASMATTLGEAAVVGLQYMTPGWSSPTGQWQLREIREVWRARNRDGVEILLFRDTRGKEHDGTFGRQRREVLSDRQLLLTIEAAQPRRQRAARDTSRAAKRPVGSRARQKQMLR